LLWVERMGEQGTFAPQSLFARYCRFLSPAAVGAGA